MNSQELTSIGWTLREMAVDARVTLGQLLREAGVSPATVSRWRNGETSPRPATIKRLNDAAALLRARNRQ